MSSKSKSAPSSCRRHRRRAASLWMACLRFAAAHPADGRAPPFEDTGLLRRDQPERIAELAGMVEGDAGDDRQGRPNDVGRVEPSSHADLEHDRPHPAAGEQEQSHRRGDLEERRAATVKTRLVALELLDDLPHLIDQIDQLRPGDRSPVDGEPLLESMEVWRTVHARPHARGRQRRRHQCRCRSFALGPRDVDDRQAILGIAQPLKQAPHPPQVQRGRHPGHPQPLVIQPAIEIIEAFLIIGQHGVFFRKDEG